MKVLLDTCVSRAARDALVAAGHDVVGAGEWPQDPGDEEILAFAHREGRVVVTLDKDFGELATLRGQSHCGIVRLVAQASREQGPASVAALARFGRELDSGAIVTVERHRTRVRSAGAARRH